MGLQCFMYVLRINILLLLGDDLPDIDMMCISWISRWPMVEQTSDFIVVQILVQMSQSTSPILLPMTM